MAFSGSKKRAGAGRVLWLQKKRPRRRSVGYQSLPPEPAPVLPLPEPTPVRTEPVLAKTDFVAVPSAGSLGNEIAVTQPVALPEEKPVVSEQKIVSIVPVDGPKRTDAELLKPAIVPPPVSEVAVIEEPAPSTPVVATPIAAFRPPVEKTEKTVNIHVVKPAQTYYATSRLYGEPQRLHD